MIIHDVEQGSPEWLAARLGIPTASEVDKIITSTGGVSTQAAAYSARLLAEIITGKPVQTFEKTPYMDRGNELEQEAADYYSFQNDIDLIKVGFCTNDEKTFGCSPDRLIGDDGLLEIKCPAPHTHVQYLLKGEVDRGYYPQIQGQLLVTGRKWCDWLSYNPDMPSLIIRVERDTQYIMSMVAALNKFTKNLNEQKETLKQKGYIL